MIVALLFFAAACLGQFDLEDTKVNNFYAYSAYCSGHNLDLNYNCYWCRRIPADRGFTLVSSFGNPKNVVAGFVGYERNTKTVVVSFRGTSNTAGWLSDLSFPQVPYKRSGTKAKVHVGFLLAHDSVKDDVDSLVRQGLRFCEGSCNRILVVGHSLGGALATLSALELARTIPNTPPIDLRTFGSPRVGDPNFVRYFKSAVPIRSSFRIVADRDPVPQTPPRKLFFTKWEHVPSEIWLSGDNQDIRQCALGSGDKDFVNEDSACSYSKRNLFTSEVWDHTQYFKEDLGTSSEKCFRTD